LLDRSQSITAHVTTLSNNWQEFQQKIIAVNEQLEKVKGKVMYTHISHTHCSSNINNLYINIQISMADNKNRLLSNSIDQLMSLYKKPLDTVTTQTNQVDTNNNEVTRFN